MTPTPPTFSTSTWRRLVILAPNWLGDAVMCEPVIRAIHATHPGMELIWAGNRVALTALRGHPAIAEFHPVDDRGLRSMVAAASSIRRLGADAMIAMRGSARSGILARLSGTPTRIGLGGEGRRLLLTHPLPRPSSDRPRPTVELYASIVAAIGVETEDLTPALTTTASEEEAARSLFEGVDGPILGVVPGGSKPAKRWPVDRFRDVIARIGDRFAAVAVFGGPDERDLVRDLAEGHGTSSRVLDLPARGLSLENLRGAVARCRVLLTNDTGPRHLAIGLKVPTVALFGPTDHRWTTVPGASERLLLAEPFLDDSHVADRHPDACRIDRIPASDVVHAIVGQLVAK